jgi:hypothetical protein
MNMVDAAYDMAQTDDFGDDYSTLLEFLNGPNFRTFGEGLETIIRAKMPQEYAKSPKEYLEQRCAETGISVASSSTLRNWFNGSPRPKKSEKSREDMFALAFALDLTVDETRKLFHRVYLDRAYNKRNYRELIYYHCLKNRLTYEHANKLISMVVFESDIKDETVYTAVLSKQAADIFGDMQLIAYINTHPHNFHLDNVSAVEEYHRQ